MSCFIIFVEDERVVGPTFAYLRLNSVGGYSEALEDEACLPAIFTSTQIHKYCCRDSYEYIKKLSSNIYCICNSIKLSNHRNKSACIQTRILFKTNKIMRSYYIQLLYYMQLIYKKNE